MAKKDFKTNTASMFISNTEDPAEVRPAQQSSFVVPKGFRLVKESKTERMQLLVRPATKKAIKEEADALGISMNDFVNSLFEEYFNNKNGND